MGDWMCGTSTTRVVRPLWITTGFAPGGDCDNSETDLSGDAGWAPEVSAEAGLASQATARCADLEQQFAVALKAHPGSKATKAAALGSQADKLCTHGQPALGLRTYIRAFRALGVEPKLPQE